MRLLLLFSALLGVAALYDDPRMVLVLCFVFVPVLLFKVLCPPPSGREDEFP